MSHAGGLPLTDTVPSRGYLLAADIGGTRLRMLLASADGAPIGRWATAMSETHKHPGGVLHLLEAGTRTMLAAAPAAPLLHITAGSPGVTDAAHGTVVAAPNLPGWADVPLRQMLEDRFDTPAAVDNDTNLAALGEGAAGAACGVADYVFVAMGTGVGAGIVLGNRLVRGATGAAGEIGYLQPAGYPFEPVCMSRPGALEEQIGGLGIERHWRDRLLAAGGDSRLTGLRASEIFDRAAGGDPLAGEVLQWAASLLGQALLTVMLLLDPPLIVLGGGVGSHPALPAAVRAALALHAMHVPRVVSSTLGTEAQLYGAIATSRAALATLSTKARC